MALPFIPSMSNSYYGPSGFVLPDPGPVTASTPSQPSFYNNQAGSSSQPPTPQTTLQAASAASGPSTLTAQVPATATPLTLER